MQCLKTECVTNIAFITLIDIVFENGMHDKYYIYSLIDVVFENGMREKYYIYSLIDAVFQSVTQPYLVKENPSSPNRSRTYDLPITSSDVFCGFPL